jgi:hypothetical protein
MPNNDKLMHKIEGKWKGTHGSFYFIFSTKLGHKRKGRKIYGNSVKSSWKCVLNLSYVSWYWITNKGMKIWIYVYVYKKLIERCYLGKLCKGSMILKK